MTTPTDWQPVKSLAHEIGAKFLPTHESEAFLGEWFRLLALEVRWATRPGICEYAEDLMEWIDAFCHAVESDFVQPDEIPSLRYPMTKTKTKAERLRRVLQKRDSYDGWCTDPAGAAFEAVLVAVNCSMTENRAVATRWPAEAGGKVWRFLTGARNYNEAVSYSNHAWLRRLYDRTASRMAIFDDPKCSGCGGSGCVAGGGRLGLPPPGIREEGNPMTKLANNPEAVGAISRDDIASLLAEGFHAAFRKASNHPEADAIWHSIHNLPMADWSNIVDFVAGPIEARFAAAIAEARDEGLEEAAREFDEYAKLARYYEQQAIDAGRTDEAAQHQTDAVDNEVAAIEIRALKGKP